MSTAKSKVGLILAGGLSQRMDGREKAFLPLAGKPLLQHVIQRAKPQVDELKISANGDPARFASFGCEVVADAVGGFLGPLAGILSGLQWMRKNRPKARWLASFACDTPFFPNDMVDRLIDKAEAEKAAVAVAASRGRRHHVFAVWSALLPDEPETVLLRHNLRKMEDWIGLVPNTAVEFDPVPFDPFFNINAPGDLDDAERLLANAQGDA